MKPCCSCKMFSGRKRAASSAASIAGAPGRESAAGRIIDRRSHIMRFWIREIMGWILVGLGLFLFYMCVVLFFNYMVIQVGPLFVIGIVVFRGGIHLLKVAVAARICLQAQGKTEAGHAIPPKASVKPRGFRTTVGKPRDRKSTRLNSSHVSISY